MTSKADPNPLRFSEIVNALPGMIFFCSEPEKNRMNYLSEGCLSITAYTATELMTIEGGYDGLIYPEDFAEVEQVIKTAIATQQPYQVQYRITAKSGEQRWLREQGRALFRSDGSLAGIAGLVTEITETKLAQAQLQHDAFYDQLTELPNRSLFMDRLDRLVKRTHRNPDSRFALLFLDLDRFKIINDSLGHGAGDQLLAEVAQRLQKNLRPGDTVARLGGDEFTMLIDDIKVETDVTQVCDRILNDMKHPFVLEGRAVYTTTSIGIAISHDQYRHPDELLRDADIALYQAKAAGKACYALFTPNMHIQAIAQLELETDLRQAIERQEFILNFQPIMSLETSTLVGFEALLSWQHPQYGLMPPLEFLPIAEETGLMPTIGYWVLTTACQQMRQWQLRYPHTTPYFITVNLSSREICHPQLLDMLQQVLTDTQLPAHCLKLDITETTLLEQSEAVMERFQQLQALGIQVCIDDFGTGYSSLSYLRNFAASALKIDHSFISKLEEQDNLDIVQTILNLAQTLGLEVVAEGVETINQLVQLRALRCQLGQGHFLARPLAAHAVDTLLEQESGGHRDRSDGFTATLPNLVIHKSAGTSHLLLAGRLSWSIGRSPENDILLTDRLISREHAMILRLLNSSDFYFVDLWSRNGSWINGQRITAPKQLKDGDRLRLGKTELEFFLGTPQQRTAVRPEKKTVLLTQASHDQGDIWQDLLGVCGIEVLWQAADIPLDQTLKQFELCGEQLPDLLLLDITTLDHDLDTFWHWHRLTYPNLSLILTGAGKTDPVMRSLEGRAPSNCQLIPCFPDVNNLMGYQGAITEILAIVLQTLDVSLPAPPVLEERLRDLQFLFNNRTLH